MESQLVSASTSQQLEFQANRIEAVLNQNKINARVTGGTVTPRWVRFTVIPAIGQRLNSISNLADELAAAMQVDNCRVARHGAALAVEIANPNPIPVRLLPLYDQITLTGQSLPHPVSRLSRITKQPFAGIPPITAVLGLAQDGAPLLIRLPSPDVAHILIAGTTGSGKTELARAMIASLALANTAANLRLVLVGTEGFAPFSELRHLAVPPITHPHDALSAIHTLVGLLDSRKPKDSQQDEDARPSGPTVVLFIDELADLLMVGGSAAVWSLTRLVQRGRAAGIHVVAATQKPTAAVLGPLVKANFPVRLVGKVTCTDDARTATGWGGTGAERLEGSGDFLAVAEGRITRFQAALITEQEIRQVVRRLPRQCEPLFQVQEQPADQPQPQADPDEVLAGQLRASPTWAARHDPGRPGGYRWGFISEACKALFGRPAEGTWYQTTQRVIAKAEEQEEN